MIDSRAAELWSDIANNLKQAQDLVSDAQAIMMVNSRVHGMSNPQAIMELDKANNAIHGLHYLFAPQSDINSNGDLTFREPHVIAKNED